MKTVELGPDQIITLNDYPVYSAGALRYYFERCNRGEELPLIPVIKKDIVKVHFDGELLEKFGDFERDNKAADYFMLDGTHRMTALTLTGRRIRAIIYEDDEDIVEARKHVATGEVLRSGTLNHSLEENCEILNRHFGEKPYFMTVGQKTKKMVIEDVLPKNVKKSWLRGRGRSSPQRQVKSTRRSRARDLR